MFSEASRKRSAPRRGMLRKVREGNPNVIGWPRYGFRYNEAKDALLVIEPEMRVVEKIFRMACRGVGAQRDTGRSVRRGRTHRNGQEVRVGASDDTSRHRERHVPPALLRGALRACSARGSRPTGPRRGVRDPVSGTTARGSQCAPSPSRMTTAVAVTETRGPSSGAPKKSDRHPGPRVPPPRAGGPGARRRGERKKPREEAPGAGES
jgi:hypothetical protein